MSCIAVTDETFEAEVLNSDQPVLVDFWAEWCGPCKALSPVLEEIAAEKKGSLKIVKVNIEDAPDAPTKYNVRGVPTMILFKDGKAVGTRVGGMPKAQLTEWIEENS